MLFYFYTKYNGKYYYFHQILFILIIPVFIKIKLKLYGKYKTETKLTEIDFYK